MEIIIILSLLLLLYVFVMLYVSKIVDYRHEKKINKELLSENTYMREKLYDILDHINIENE